MRILAVDHGQKRIGLAISDESGKFARPLQVIPHTSRIMDAAQAAERASAEDVRLIVVGVSYDEDGNPNPAGRSALKFIEALQQQTHIPVETWDESFTTQDARALQIEMGRTRKKRAGHLDEHAAAMLLQDYLNAH